MKRTPEAIELAAVIKHSHDLGTSLRSCAGPPRS